MRSARLPDAIERRDLHGSLGARVAERGAIDRIGREVVIALDNDSLVGLGEHSSVQNSFDHDLSAQEDWGESRQENRSLYSKLRIG